MARGGRRPGAGRPKGSTNSLPLGTVKAIHAGKVAERRLGKDSDASPEAKAAVEYAFERVGDVLAGNVSVFKAASVLKAAGMVCDAVAGPQAQKVQHSFAEEHAAAAARVAAAIAAEEKAPEGRAE